MSTAAPLQNTAAKPSPVSKPSHAALLLQRKCACGGSPGLAGECEACKKKRLQKKLSIGASNDPLEQEADRVAEQVLSTPAHSAVSATPPRIQRFTGQATSDTGTAPTSVDRVLSGSGRPLDTALQKDMGNRFGYDFSTVRVHTGSAAEQSARDVNAHAYTVGNNVVFGAGQFAPESHAGRKLIAHELTHVVQQGSGVQRVQRQAAPAASGGAPQSLADQALDSAFRAIRAAATLVPGLGPLVAASDLIRGAVYMWNHRYEHLERLMNGIDTAVQTVPALARAKMQGFLTAVGPAAEAAGCIGDQMLLFLESLAQNWRQVIQSFLRDMIFVGLFERSIPAIVENVRGLLGDIQNGEFRSAIDRSVAIMTEVNAIAGVLFLWYALITTVVGAVAGSEVPVAGNAAGAAAGMALAEVVGLGLVASVVATETVRVGLGIDEMVQNWNNVIVRQAGCRRVAEGVFSLALTAALFYLGPGIQRIARSIISRAASAVRSTVTAAFRDATAALESVPALATPNPALATPNGMQFRGLSDAELESRLPTGRSGRAVRVPAADPVRIPTRAPAPSPAPDLAPSRGIATGLTTATEEPSRRMDACRSRYSLLPGINARWHHQRAPIGGNTTVDSVAFRLDAGRPAPPGQVTDAPSRAWARAIGFPADDAGHAIGRRFGGTRAYNGPNGNIFPQNLSINRGRMVVRDREAADLHSQGCDVCVHIQLNYGSSTNLRPNEVVHTIIARSPGARDFVPPSPPEVLPNP